MKISRTSLILILAMVLFYNFAISQSSHQDVFVFDLDINKDHYQLSKIKNISAQEGYDNQPSFIDDHKILFSSTRNGQTDIRKYDLFDNSLAWMTDTPGSEFSPTITPDGQSISTVVLEKNGFQYVAQYDLAHSSLDTLINDIVIGYYTWMDQDQVASAVLDDGQLSLYVSDLKSGNNQMIEKNIGRSLHRITNTNRFSYISKADTIWKIKSYDIKTKEIKTIAPTLAKAEDMCWLSDGTMMMAKASSLFVFKHETDVDWREVASLETHGIRDITRVAINPSNNKLAIAAIDKNQILSPVLNNISWISGSWKGEALGGQVEENWSQPSGSSMMATFKFINDDKVAFYEIEIIRQIEGSLILQLKHFNNDLTGWEEKNKTVDFPLIKVTPYKVEFDGMTFEKVNNNEMMVYVDVAQDNGEIEVLTFHYFK